MVQNQYLKSNILINQIGMIGDVLIVGAVEIVDELGCLAGWYVAFVDGVPGMPDHVIKLVSDWIMISYC